LANLAESVRVFVSDVAGGCFVITHNSLALLGVAVVIAVALIASRPGLRQQAETRLAAWLIQPQVAQAQVPAPAPIINIDPTAVDRATAADPDALPRTQAQLTRWIARKYQVAPEPVAALVAEAYKAGQDVHIDPALILSVMAIESGFNPFAQSTAGAQGLMQVMTRVHVEKYDDYGGQFAAFDPLSNLRVGAWVLRDCIDKAGSTEGGLRCYVGATHLKTDQGYANKVLGEYQKLQQVIAKKESHQQFVKTMMTAPHPNQTARTSKPKKVNSIRIASAKTDS
jgi:hypothetical protein